MSTTTGNNRFDKQERILEESSAAVRKHGYYMKENLDQKNFGPALAQASEMIQQLRTSDLSPQNYYELYIAVTDELRFLQDALEELHAEDPTLNLYEIVQYAGNLIPRLYLLCTVGAVYIRQRTSEPLNVLKDLLEMCKGVQHPTRGLFLRHYLSQLAKDLLPDIDSEYFSTQAELPMAVDFIIENFSEMNRLWVRMKYQGTVRDRTQREKQRKNLRMIVGTNLVRLSQLESVDATIYGREVLPRILELVEMCNDKLAQEYLMDCLIQVFPDEYHLVTLNEFLATVAKLKEEVEIKDIVIAMMDRLSNFAYQNPGAIPEDMEMLPLFQDNVNSIMQQKQDLSLDDVLDLQVALLNFAAKVYPERLEYLDNVLGTTGEMIERRGGNLSNRSAQSVLQLLTRPLNGIGVQIFRLANYAPLMKHLTPDLRRQCAVAIGKTVVSLGFLIRSVEGAEILFEYLDPLIRDMEGAGPASANRYEFEQDQYLMARLIHLLRAKDCDNQYNLLLFARTQFAEGGNERLRFTLPPLVFCALGLADSIVDFEEKGEEMEVSLKKVYQFVHKVTTVLREYVPNIALKLFLQAALSADRYNLDEIVFEFITQAFITYEEEIADSRELKEMVALITASIESLRNLGEVDEEDYYDTVSTQATQHSARLLKKHDKVAGILRCSHLFWAVGDAKRVVRGDMVLKCLKRALKVANTIMDQGVRSDLFCDVLSKYLYYIGKDVQEIEQANVSDLIELVRHAIQDIDDDPQAKENVEVRFLGIIKHLQYLQQSDDRYAKIEI